MIQSLFIIFTFPMCILCNYIDKKSNAGERYGRRLLYHPRILNFIWASWFGYFWLLCPLCNRKFGGHESGRMLYDYNSASGVSVCKKCSIEAEELNDVSYLEYRRTASVQL